MKVSPDKQWKRLQGRWVVVAYKPWDKQKVYYRRRQLPTPKLTNAHSFATRAQARNCMRFINNGQGSSLRWYPQQIKDTELFLEILK